MGRNIKNKKVAKVCYKLFLVMNAMDILIYKKHHTKSGTKYAKIQKRLNKLISIERKLKHIVITYFNKNKKLQKIIKV